MTPLKYIRQRIYVPRKTTTVAGVLLSRTEINNLIEYSFNTEILLHLHECSYNFAFSCDHDLGLQGRDFSLFSQKVSQSIILVYVNV